MPGVAVAQLLSSENRDENLRALDALFSEASQKGAELLVLPENFAFMGRNELDKLTVAEAEGTGLIQQTLSNLSRIYNIWVVAGTVPLKAPDGRVWASSLVFDANGRQVARYDKMHLFDADLGSESWQESKYISFGASPTMQTLNDPWKVGLSICYDLRFPELYSFYQQQGCNILTVPAAFTVPTGIAHWLPLLQARAIENQCYVLAAGQSGEHNDGRTTYGHSLIIDPWGKVLNCLEEGEGYISADLSLETLTKIRQRMPVLLHRREI